MKSQKHSSIFLMATSTKLYSHKYFYYLTHANAHANICDLQCVLAISVFVLFLSAAFKVWFVHCALSQLQ